LPEVLAKAGRAVDLFDAGANAVLEIAEKVAGAGFHITIRNESGDR